MSNHPQLMSFLIDLAAFGFCSFVFWYAFLRDVKWTGVFEIRRPQTMAQYLKYRDLIEVQFTIPSPMFGSCSPPLFDSWSTFLRPGQSVSFLCQFGGKLVDLTAKRCWDGAPIELLLNGLTMNQIDNGYAPRITLETAMVVTVRLSASKNLVSVATGSSNPNWVHLGVKVPADPEGGM